MDEADDPQPFSRSIVEVIARIGFVPLPSIPTCHLKGDGERKEMAYFTPRNSNKSSLKERFFSCEKEELSLLWRLCGTKWFSRKLCFCDILLAAMLQDEPMFLRNLRLYPHLSYSQHSVEAGGVLVSLLLHSKAALFGFYKSFSFSASSYNRCLEDRAARIGAKAKS